MTLLCSEAYIKSHTAIDANLQSGYINVALREVQDYDLRAILGSKLVDKLISLVENETINDNINVKYKTLLDKAQPYIAYQAVSKVILYTSPKISNFGASLPADININSLNLEEILKLKNVYQKYADTYAKELQRFVLENAFYYPELEDNGAYDIKAQLKSAASSGLFLGGARGKRVKNGKGCCDTVGNSGGGGGGGEGTIVGWRQIVENGVEIAEISIDGQVTRVYAPSGISAQDVAEIVATAMGTETARTESTYAKQAELQDYATTATTDNLEQSLSGFMDYVGSAFTGVQEYVDSALTGVQEQIDTKQDALIPGEGIVISGNTISVSGGTQAEENYRIVSSLDEIEEPYEGLKAYVRSGSSTEQKAGYYFQANSITEGFVAILWLGQVGQDERWKIYRSGTNFHWDWVNDGQMHRMENGERYCNYIADKANATFYIFPDNIEDYTVESFADASGETTTGVTNTWPSASYMYDGSSWVYISDIVYVLDEMLQSERAALVAYMTSLSEEERIGAHIYKDKTKCRYRGIEGDGKIGFECEYMDFGYGYPTMKVYTFYVNPNGTFEYTVNGTEYPLPLDAKVDYDNHTLTKDRTDLWGIGRCVEKGAPLTLILLSGNTRLCTSKNAWVTYKNGYEGTIGGEFEYSGSTIKCEWSYLENNATLLYWNVETGLPIATNNSLGTVQIGEGLSVTSAGTLSSNFRQYIFVTDLGDNSHNLYVDPEWDCNPLFENLDTRQDVSVRVMSAWSLYSYAKSSWIEINDSGECIVNAVMDLNGSEVKAAWRYDMTGYSFTNIDWAPVTTPIPVATSSVLGGVKIGSGMTVENDGTIHPDFIQYSLLTDITDASHFIYPDYESDMANFCWGGNMMYRDDVKVTLMSSWTYFNESKYAWTEKDDSGNCYLNAAFEVNGDDIRAKWSWDSGNGFTNIAWAKVPNAGRNVYVLNLMSQQERLEMYNLISSYRGLNARLSSDFPYDEYAFYVYAPTQTDYGLNDRYDGFIRMDIASVHPTDYGGGIFFVGFAPRRMGSSNEVKKCKYNVKSDGTVDSGAVDLVPNIMAKSAYITISDSAGTVSTSNVTNVDQYLAQFNDRDMSNFAFSMYLCYTPGDAERYRGNLVNFRKNYNGVNGNFFFRFIIDIDGVEYEAEYYRDKDDGNKIKKIVFQPYKDYLQSILNS